MHGMVVHRTITLWINTRGTYVLGPTCPVLESPRSIRPLRRSEHACVPVGPNSAGAKKLPRMRAESTGPTSGKSNAGSAVRGWRTS